MISTLKNLPKVNVAPYCNMLSKETIASLDQLSMAFLLRGAAWPFHLYHLVSIVPKINVTLPDYKNGQLYNMLTL